MIGAIHDVTVLLLVAIGVSASNTQAHFLQGAGQPPEARWGSPKSPCADGVTGSPIEVKAAQSVGVESSVKDVVVSGRVQGPDGDPLIKVGLDLTCPIAKIPGPSVKAVTDAGGLIYSLLALEQAEPAEQRADTASATPGQAKGAQDSGDGKAKKETVALEGTWTFDSSYVDGKKQQMEWKRYEFTLKAGKATVRWEREPKGDDPGEQGEDEFDFTIDVSKEPKEISWAIGIEGERKQLGIYRIEKDTLTMALFGKTDITRPKGFDVKDAGGDDAAGPLLVRVFKRAGKDTNQSAADDKAKE